MQTKTALIDVARSPHKRIPNKIAGKRKKYEPRVFAFSEIEIVIACLVVAFKFLVVLGPLLALELVVVLGLVLEVLLVIEVVVVSKQDDELNTRSML